jgi:hypothetical protein
MELARTREESETRESPRRNLVLCECITKDLTQKLLFCTLYTVHTLSDGGPKCFLLLFSGGNTRFTMVGQSVFHSYLGEVTLRAQNAI